MQEQEIIDRIHGLYPDAVIEASGENCSFEVYVVDAGFADMKPLARQQSILQLFNQDLQSGKLHALSIKARTPQELTSKPNNLVQIRI
ncbi:MAG: BolA/IbaG family iron-sulfur metabolism protein [gamma proteobacterium symbiont of Phacoides pectinatus]